MRKQEQGFSLIETLVVVSIIALIVSISMASFQRVRMETRDTKRLADFKNLTTALELYYSKYNKYPCGSLTTPGGITETDGDWLHANTPADSFLNSVPVSGFSCSASPTNGLVTDGLINYGIHDPNSANSAYVYEVANDRQSYILYTILESGGNVNKMANDGGFISCFYELGSGVGKIRPYWICQ